MTALLISLALVVVLVVALQPAHKRSWRPGFDSRVDRDRARLAEELLLLQSFEPTGRGSVVTGQAAEVVRISQDPDDHAAQAPTSAARRAA